MVRPVLAAFAATWLLAGIVAIGLGLAGADWLLARLPPLAVEAPAVGGAATALGSALAIVAFAHLVVIAGLGGDRRWAMTAGTLLSASAAAVLTALAAAAVVSAARLPDQAAILGAAGLCAVAAAVAYAWCAVALTRRLGRIGPSGGPP